MRVLMDCRLNFYRKAGITQYARRLLAALATSNPSPDLHVLLDRRDRDSGWVPKTVRIWQAVTPAHHRLEPYTLPLELRLKQFDVLHSPDFITVPGPWRKVITIHDLYFMHNAGVMSRAGADYYLGTVRSAQRADAVIAVSAFTRADVLQLIPNVAPERVHVVHEAADVAPHSAPTAASSNTSDYALFIGTLEPRKNLPVLLRALALAPDVYLRIVGAPGWGEEGLHALAQALGVSNRIQFEQNHVDDAARDHLIRGARLLVLPSLYEGFGLPPLEAMARGVPVICSNAGSLPEVVGDAALLHDPHDHETLARHLRVLWADPKARTALAGRGLVQASGFSWDRAARETLAVYAQALS